MSPRQTLSAFLSVVVFIVFLPFIAEASGSDDRYIAGYASAVLEQEFHLTMGSLTVQDGAVTVIAEDRMVSALSKIRGVTRVDVLPRRHIGSSSAHELATGAVSLDDNGGQWFPRGQLFDPLHADPRWPHFAASLRSYRSPGEGGLNTAFVGDFGETFSIYRNKAPFGQWEVGVQAGVFSLFDIGSDRKQLTNGDYMVSLLTSYRAGDWSAFLRYLHQSSHLGDEFLLSTSVRRVNVSYEMVDAKLSYDFLDVLRLYGGAGLLVRRDPADLAPFRTQYGFEVQSPWTIVAGIRPVAYADFQTYQQTGEMRQQDKWNTNVSLRAGLQFENLRICDRKLQFLLEYYSGYSPNGQFYTRRIETIGIGIHVYF
jgi:hypothetical protein